MSNRRLAAALLTATLGAAVLASPASGGAPCPDDGGVPAVRLQPCNLTVDGGEDAWHSGDSFFIRWDNPSQGSGPPLAATHYQVRDPGGAPLGAGEERLGWVDDSVNVRVSSTPGVYTFEVWLENASGEEGAIATAKLRYDPVRPEDVEPVPVLGWLGRGDFPFTVHISHPAEPFPLSGIRGYAVSIGDGAQGNPCADAFICTDAETDLREGEDGDLFTVPGLPEGTSYVHAVAVSGSGMKSATAGHTAVKVDLTDPVTTLSGVPAGWVNRPVTVTAVAGDDGSGMGGDAFTAIRLDDGAPRVEPGSVASATAIDEGTHTFSFYACDAAGNANDGGAGPGVPNRPPTTATVRIDRGPPSVSFANSQSPLDPEAIQVRVADALSGPDLTRGQIEVRRSGTSDLYQPLPTTASENGLSARWDSDAYPAGTYEFRATGYDAAGNAVTTAWRANGTRMALVNPLKLRTVLWAGFGGREVERRRCVKRGLRWRCRRIAVGDFGRRGRERLVPYGGGARYSGRLSAGLGTGLSGVEVQVTERFDPGALESDRTTVARTDGRGVFTVSLAPGPSRQIEAHFSGDRTRSRSSAGTARLRVAAGVLMRSSSRRAKVGGRPVVFRGKVGTASAAVPPDGKTIQLQFQVPGVVPWTQFRTIQTDARGRFRFPYAFSDDDSRGIGFQFRAYVPAQSGWPYEPAVSRPVTVTGR
ncbi:MAG TPA: hypothetical protein VF176_03540 [Solirubrobacterales bacterium]